MVYRAYLFFYIIAIHVTAMILIGTVAACTAIFITIINHRGDKNHQKKKDEGIVKSGHNKVSKTEPENIPLEATSNYYTNSKESRLPRVFGRATYRHVDTTDLDIQATYHAASNSCEGLASERQTELEGQTDIDLVPEYGVIRKEAEVARSLDTICDDNKTHQNVVKIDCNCRDRRTKLTCALPHRDFDDKQAEVINAKDVLSSSQDIDQKTGTKCRALSKRIDRVMSTFLSIMAVVVVISLFCFFP